MLSEGMVNQLETYSSRPEVEIMPDLEKVNVAIGQLSPHWDKISDAHNLKKEMFISDLSLGVPRKLQGSSGSQGRNTMMEENSGKSYSRYGTQEAVSRETAPERRRSEADIDPKVTPP